MSRRRGQIRKREPQKYLVRIYLGRIDGKRKYTSKTVRGTRKEAEEVLTQMLRKKDAGRNVGRCKQTLASFLEEWVEAKKPSVASSTYGTYRKAIRLHIRPDLGHLKLHAVNPQLVQQFYTALSEEKGLSPSYVRQIHAVLHQALKKAYAWGKIERNPADTDLVDLPKAEEVENRIFTRDEVARFLDVTEDDRFHALWVILLTTGLRPSEALALKWEDIDDEGWMRVRRTLTLADYKSGRYEVTSNLKTKRSKRRIKLPAFVLDVLDTHRRKQAKRILIAGHHFEDQGFLFANGVGSFWDINRVRSRFKAALRKADLSEEIRLYDTRHTHISHLIMNGVDLKLASARAGHSSIQLTADTYAKVLPESEEMMADTVENLYGHQQRNGTHG